MPIVSNPKIRSGVPVFKGTRMPVYTLFAWLGDGYSIEAILAEFPRMTPENVKEAYEFAAELLSQIPENGKVHLMPYWMRLAQEVQHDKG